MSEQSAGNEYARLLKEQGIYVISVGGVDWYDYSGFMVPAYLPHCCPAIDPSLAKTVVKLSGRPFARWDSEFGRAEAGEWWYVLRKGPWDIEKIKDKKTRWMIRQGRKNFTVRPLGFDEIISKCPQVAALAAGRYRGRAKVETEQVLEQRIQAAQIVPGVLEYVGCFHGDTLVSYSENYLQSNAVWLANIRHDPAFLKSYSSYGLVDAILDYYLNNKRMCYVLDGSRSIHHRTQFQDHLVKVFGFTKEYAILNIEYSRLFKMGVRTAYPFRGLFWRLANVVVRGVLDDIGAVLRQEEIRRACAGRSSAVWHEQVRITQADPSAPSRLDAHE